MSPISVNRVTKNSFAKVNHELQTLRPGQIVQGKIVKLYPENKAQIQLGSQMMIAQLEASLTIGERYHFQVQTAGDMIHLKVLGDQLNNEERINIKSLLQQLGLRASKSNVSFMQTLIKEKIPFDKSQLANALPMLDGAKQKFQSYRVLKEMIAMKLPITNSIFQALFESSTSGITEQMKALLNSLKQDTNQVKLMERLSRMVERPLNTTTTLVKQIISENRNNDPQLFNLLKASGTIHRLMKFSVWQSQWGAFEKQYNLTPINMSNHQLESAELPFQMNSTKIYQELEVMISNKVGLQGKAQEMMQLWGNKLSQSVANNDVMSTEEFSQLKQQITQQIIPLLSKAQQQQFTKSLQNDPLQLRQLLANLEMLLSDQNFTKAVQALTKMNVDKTFLLSSPKGQFLSQLNQTLQFTGLAYENQLMNADIQQQSNTVKGMLLQMLPHTDGAIHEHGQQLLHFINGMQINAVHDAGNFIQAAIQIPGERLGLNNDLKIEFEGNKTSNGEINPDYCRIVFYLDLAHLKATVIDMNIHKRAVTVTIFNDVEHMKDQTRSLHPLLKQGLEAIHYNLSSITFKPLMQRDEPKVTKQAPSNQHDYEGVDYRI